MKKKFVGLSAVTLLALSGYAICHAIRDKKEEKITSDIRAFFADFGQVELVYFNLKSKTVTGGVVLVDGRQFRFSYAKGVIDYEEDGHEKSN